MDKLINISSVKLAVRGGFFHRGSLSKSSVYSLKDFFINK